MNKKIEKTKENQKNNKQDCKENNKDCKKSNEQISKKSLKHAEKISKKNENWIKKFGVPYSDCLDKKDKKTGKKVKGHYKKLTFLFKEFKKNLVFFTFLGIILAIFGIIVPICWQQIIDGLTVGNFDIVIQFAIIVTAYAVLSSIINYFYGNSINKTYHKMSNKIRLRLFTDISNTQISVFNKKPTGEIINRISSSTNNFSADLVNVISYMVEILGNIVFVIYAFFINVYLGAILLGIGFFRYASTTFYNKKFRKIYKKRGNIITDKAVSHYNEMVRGIRDVKSLNAKSVMKTRAAEISENTMNSNIQMSVSFKKYVTFRASVTAVLLLGFILLGVYFVKTQVVTIGAFIILIMYRGNVFQFFDTLGLVKTSYQDLEINAERIYEIIDDTNYTKEQFGAEILNEAEGKLEFKNVQFSYEDNQPLFENINFVINPNECVGFVGKSGQGKSTIMNLITKFYDCKSGEVLLDDINIKSLTEESIRNNIAVVQQSPYIFNLSIKENLLLAKENATNEELEEACKKAYIHEFIETLPDGYNSKVGEGGITLSGGQKQRLALARAFLKNSKILLLDEATSAVDNESQLNILQAINDLQKNKTIIIVAHRLSTIKTCDKIFVVENNEISAVGSHEQLIKSCELYRNLYNNEEVSKHAE